MFWAIDLASWLPISSLDDETFFYWLGGQNISELSSCQIRERLSLWLISHCSDSLYSKCLWCLDLLPRFFTLPPESLFQIHGFSDFKRFSNPFTRIWSKVLLSHCCTDQGSLPAATYPFCAKLVLEPSYSVPVQLPAVPVGTGWVPDGTCGHSKHCSF